MPYADKTFYRSTYIGRACSDDTTLEKWLNRATDDLNIFTFGSIVADDLDAVQLDALQKACCAQAENYLINGDDIGSVKSVSLGSFSMSEDATEGGGQGVLCERAERYLSLSGLLFRGVKVCGQSRVRY